MRPRSFYLMLLCCGILLVVACSQRDLETSEAPSSSENILLTDYTQYEMTAAKSAIYGEAIEDNSSVIAPGLYQTTRKNASKLTLNSDGTFLFYVHPKDTLGYSGTYEVIDSELALFANTSDSYYFTINPDGGLTFEAEKSNIYNTYENPKKGLMDGDIFQMQ